MKSQKWALNVRDYLHSALMVAAGAVVDAIIPMLQTGAFPSKEKLLSSLQIGLGIGLAYLLKNLVQNSNGQITKPEEQPK